MKGPMKITGTACLAAGLLSTWDVCPANASQSFAGELTPTHDLTEVYFLFGVGPCSPPIRQVYSKKISDFIPANTTTAFNLTLTSAPDNDPGQYYAFALIGLYDAPNGGVTLSYDPTGADGLFAITPAPEWTGTTLPVWFDGFGLFYQPEGYDVTEASAAAALESGVYNGIPMDDARIDGLLDPHLGIHQGELSLTPFTLVDFSGAANGGSGSFVQVVPEPKPISFLVTGAAFLSFGWLRRRK